VSKHLLFNFSSNEALLNPSLVYLLCPNIYFSIFLQMKHVLDPSFRYFVVPLWMNTP
jgi:hypothetical protein